jgi:hypothetical protein
MPPNVSLQLTGDCFEVVVVAAAPAPPVSSHHLPSEHVARSCAWALGSNQTLRRVVLTVCAY